MNNSSCRLIWALAFSLLLSCAGRGHAQASPNDGAQTSDLRDRAQEPGGRGGPPPGGVQEKLKLVAQFDKNGNHRLDAEERKAALTYLEANPRARRGPGGPGGPGRRPPGGPRGMRGESSEAPTPGQKIRPEDVASYPSASLYDPNVIRTVFIQFDEPAWEKQLAAFKNTDVELTATLKVDGQTLNDVGIHFRGMSSFMMVGEGQKRSLNLTLDFVNKDQRLYGYHSLELLNSHEDPSFLRSVLSYGIAREYIPAPKANFVRVVINGENWGIYVNAQPFNKEFLKENFGGKQGSRWKVPGSPNGRGGLSYLGEDSTPYRAIYDLKSSEDPKAWSALIELCRILDKTPEAELEKELSRVLDIEGALKFLALENALINNDGYWIRASDYNLFLDAVGKFHLIPHDSNETFMTPEAPGGPGGPGGPRPPRGNGGNADAGPDFRPDGPPPGFGPDEPEEFHREGAAGPSSRQNGPGGRGPGRASNIKGVELDPLVGAKDTSKPLLSKLLSVPALRERYLGYVRDIATRWLDWEKLGPIAQRYHSMISDGVHTDTRKLSSNAAFDQSLSGAKENSTESSGRRETISLERFAKERRAYLLSK